MRTATASRSALVFVEWINHTRKEILLTAPTDACAPDHLCRWSDDDLTFHHTVECPRGSNLSRYAEALARPGWKVKLAV